MMLNNFVFQPDNNPKHASKYAKDYFREKNIKIIEMAISIAWSELD